MKETKVHFQFSPAPKYTMATNDFVELNLPEAQLLADLASASYDLERAKEFANHLISALAPKPHEPKLAEPLTIAAIVQYCRPFTSGKRKGVRELLLGILSDEQRAKHQWIYDVRDKHIAHSVNTFEESRATARFSVERLEDEGITSVGYTHHRVISIGNDDADAIIELSTLFLGHISKWIKQEQAKLLKVVKLMPIEEVIAAGRNIHTPDFGNPRKPRS